MKTILFVLFLFLAGINAQAQLTNLANTNPDTNRTVVRAESTDKQVAVLQGQLDLMKQYDAKILATVYWALGGTFVMWGLINGFAWYANLRIYRRDKESLMQEIRDKIALETRTLENTISSKLSTGTDKLGQLVDSKVKAISDNLSQTITQLDQKLNATAASIDRDLKDVDYKFAEISALDWLTKGVGTNALRSHNTMLQISVDRQNHFRIASDLETIQTTLKTIIEKKQVKPDALLMKQLNQTFAKVPAEYQQTLNAIRKLIEALAD